MPPLAPVTEYDHTALQTDIAYGEIFLFRGLSKEPNAGNESTHEIMIVGITMWGDLLVKERYANSDPFLGRGYQGADNRVRLRDAVDLIAQGIWLRVYTVNGERP